MGIFSSVAQSCLTLCDSMNRSTPGLPVYHQLPEFTETHAHRVNDAIQPSHPPSSLFPSVPNPSQHRGIFQWVKSLHEVAKVLEFQLQHQSFQWIPRTDLLWDGLVGSPEGENQKLKKTFWGNLHIYGTDRKGRTNVNLSRLRHATPFIETYLYYMSDYRWLYMYRLSQWLSGKESICLQCRRHRRHGFNPYGRKIP